MKIKYKYLYLLFLFLLIFIPVFGYLHYLPIRLWDESRIAINALEMYYNNNFIVTHYMHQPDLWNTKPPLLIWFQVISFHSFGINEFAFRLPSALANFLILVVIIIFSDRYLKNIWIGILWVLVFITSQGIINIHSSRTGDYDMLLSSFNFIYLVSFYLFIETKKIKFLYFTFIFITLSVLTKSIAGLLFLPSLFIFSIYRKEILNILKNKHFYFGLLIFSISVFGYYALREIYNKGYVDAVLLNELGGRFMKVTEEHKESFWFYANNLINSRFNNWYFFIPIGIISVFIFKSKRIKNYSIFSLISIITFLLIISISKTKLAWYDLPLRSLISFFVAFAIFYICKLLLNSKIRFKLKAFSYLLPIVFILIILKKPYTNIIKNTYKPTEYKWDINKFAISYFLRDAVNGKIDLTNTLYVNPSYNPQNLFYIKILQNKAVDIKNVNINEVKIGDNVIFVDENDIVKINNIYLTKVILERYNIKLIKILSKKSQIYGT